MISIEYKIGDSVTDYLVLLSEETNCDKDFTVGFQLIVLLILGIFARQRSVPFTYDVAGLTTYIICSVLYLPPAVINEQ